MSKDAIRYPELGGRNAAGCWEIIWGERTPDGRYRSRRKSTGEKDHAAAAVVLARVLSEFVAALQAKGAAPAEEAPLRASQGVPTVREVVKAYLAYRVPKIPLERSREDATACLNHVLAHEIANLPANRVRERHVDTYIADRGAGRIGWMEDDGTRRGFRKGGPACQRNDMLYLNAALRWAVKSCHFEERFTAAHLNPVTPPDAPNPRLHYLSLDQVTKLLEAARSGEWRAYDREWKRDGNTFDPLYIYTLLAADTAAREEAIRELTWDRVTLSKVKDPTTLSGWRWAGSADFRVPGRPQTRKRRGVIMLSRRLAEVLGTWREQAGDSPFVLGAQHEQSMAQQFRSMHERVIGYATGPHILRHTWATLAFSAGASIGDVAHVLCDTEATVRRVYRKFILDDQKRVVDLIWDTPVAEVHSLDEARAQRGAAGRKRPD